MLSIFPSIFTSAANKPSSDKGNFVELIRYLLIALTSLSSTTPSWLASPNKIDLTVIAVGDSEILFSFLITARYSISSNMLFVSIGAINFVVVNIPFEPMASPL